MQRQFIIYHVFFFTFPHSLWLFHIIFFASHSSRFLISCKTIPFFSVSIKHLLYANFTTLNTNFFIFVWSHFISTIIIFQRILWIMNACIEHVKKSEKSLYFVFVKIVWIPKYVQKPFVFYLKKSMFVSCLPVCIGLLFVCANFTTVFGVFNVWLINPELPFDLILFSSFF